MSSSIGHRDARVRHVKRANLVLDALPIEGGFASPCGIHRCQRGRGHVYHSNTTLPDGSSYSYGITQCSSTVVSTTESGTAPLTETIENVREDLQC